MSSGAHGPVDALGLVGAKIDQVRFDACVDAGGFGLIYRGFHEGLGETVAIKCLRIASIQRTNEEIREALAGRFRDETKLLYRLSQGNLDIVRCIGSGTVIAPRTNEYTPYMVLEWLDGCTLSAELKERRIQKLRPRTLDAAVTLLDPAVGGLAYAHANDVVHRDVKPGNLFLTRTRDGVRMKVLDFGLAKILSDESIGVRPSVETGIGVHFCSPSYGAPEQFSAQLGKIGPWTDVYSLTLVLYEIMLGEKVRQAGSLADGLLKAIDPQTGSPSASSLGLRLPKAVEELLLRAVAQNPLERPHDAGVFWAALKEAIASAPRAGIGAATIMDDSVGAAMQHVREVVARASSQPPPFAATMLMQNAPGGAPHLEPFGARAGIPAPMPAAGRPPETSGGTQPTEVPVVSRSTAPLAPARSPSGNMPAVPPAPGPESIARARQRGEQLKMTMPIGSVSPLAGLSFNAVPPSKPGVAGQAGVAPEAGAFTPQAGIAPQAGVAPQGANAPSGGNAPQATFAPQPGIAAQGAVAPPLALSPLAASTAIASPLRNSPSNAPGAMPGHDPHFHALHPQAQHPSHQPSHRPPPADGQPQQRYANAQQQPAHGNLHPQQAQQAQHLQHASQLQQQQQQQQQMQLSGGQSQGAQRPPRGRPDSYGSPAPADPRTSDPHGRSPSGAPLAVAKKSPAAAIVFIVLCILIGCGGVAFYLMRSPGH